MRLFKIFLALFILTSFRLLSQSPTIEFRHMDKGMGLDQPFPFHMIQDKSGYIWIAGKNGLWRYSGSKFKHFYHNPTDSNSLSFDFIWRLLEDRNGNIWSGTYGGGLSKYDPVKNLFTNYKFAENDSATISNDQVRGLEEDSEGNIWVGTNQGLNRLNVENGKFDRFSMEDGLSSMVLRDLKLSNDEKKLFIATAGGLNIFDLETKRFKVIDTSLPEGYRLNYDYVYDVFQINDNQIMIATGSGLHLMNLTTEKVTLVPANNGKKGPSSTVVFSIKADPSDANILWLATMNGVNKYFIAEKTFYKINAIQKSEDPIDGRNIYNVLKDRNGGLWVGVNNAGIYYSHPSFNKFRTENLLDDKVEKYLNRYTSFIRHNSEEILITTYSGLVVWNHETNKKKLFKIPDPENFDINRMTGITKLRDHQYLISIWGKFMYLWDHEKQEITSLEEGSEFDKITFNENILKDSRNRIWLGNRDQGLFLYNAERNEAKAFPVTDLKKLENSGDEHIKYIFEDSKRRVWVGTEGGLHMLNDSTKMFKHYAALESENSLSNGNINHISESKNGGLWISTELGLCYFDFETEQFTRYYKEDGLPSNVVSSALEDDSGNLWVATASGLARLHANGTFSNYDQSDGLLDEYFVSGAAYKDEKLGLVFGTSTEIVMINPDEIVFNSQPPKIRLEKLIINNKIISPQNRPDVLKQGLSQTEQITLKKTDYLVNISFDALNLVNGHKNQYSVFLEGLDKNWRPPSNDRSISFSNLPAGEYILHIKACNDEKVWSTSEAGLKIEVLPFWYKSDLFRAILSVTITLLVGLIIYTRFNSIKRANRKLEETVGARTREVLAQKEEIESQNEVLQSRNNKIELLLRELNHRIKNNLQLISSILNLHSRSTDNIDAKMALTEGKLRMQALSLLHQKLYMTEKYTEVDCKEYVKELVDYLSIAFKSHYSDVRFNLDIDEFTLNLDQAVPLGLILNELVTNSLKHSRKDQLNIDLTAKKSDDRILIALTDNGIGISQDQYEGSTSFGMSMIKSLTEQIDGKLSVGCKNGPHFKLEFNIKASE